MCIEILKTNTFEIAKRDIICYKIVYKAANGIYISLSQHFEYIIRQLYNNKISKVQKDHYYMSSIDILESYNLHNHYKHFSKHLFHSYKDRLTTLEVLNIAKKKWYKDKSKIKCVKCLIPKGAYYIENRREYASSQIKILEEI